jgi:hypothetical protein
LIVELMASWSFYWKFLLLFSKRSAWLVSNPVGRRWVATPPEAARDDKFIVSMREILS